MTFKVICDNVFIQAQLQHLSGSDITAKITSPSGLKGIHVGGPHINIYARSKYSYCKDGAITQRGIEAIECSLKNAWKNYKIINANFDSILEAFYIIKLAYYIQNLHTDMLSDEQFREERRKLRKEMKTKIIDNKEYQKKLKPLNELNSVYHQMTSDIRYSFSNYMEKKYGTCCSSLGIFEHIVDSQ